MHRRSKYFLKAFWVGLTNYVSIPMLPIGQFSLPLPVSPIIGFVSIANSSPLRTPPTANRSVASQAGNIASVVENW